MSDGRENTSHLLDNLFVTAMCLTMCFLAIYSAGTNGIVQVGEFHVYAFLTLVMIVVLVLEENREDVDEDADDGEIFDKRGQAENPDAENRKRVVTEQEPPSLDTFRDLCSICIVHDKDCALGCGHRFCMRCAEHVSRCPTCRANIVQRIRTFN